MDALLFPTKGNLINAKNSLGLSRVGYDLLDKKRNILIRELMALIDVAQEIQAKIDITFNEAYEALQKANITVGISEVEQLGYTIDEETGVHIKVRSIMGVEIPIVTLEEEKFHPHYGFVKTNIALDEACIKFDKVKKLTVVLSEIENSIYRLAINIKKTQKRANALKNVMIPRYEKITKDIQNALEEKEREEFTRLKMIKNMG